MKINFDLSNLHEHVNDVYYPLFENQDRYLLLYGSAGSGKSHFAAEKILVRIMVGIKQGIHHRFLVVRKTGPAVRKSVFTLFRHYLALWGLTGIVKVNRQEMTFTFPNGSDIICTGLDDPDKLKSIEGVTGEWLEEPTELSLKDFRQLDLRLRGRSGKYKQIILSFNPISSLSWLHDEFFKREKRSTTVLHTTYKDNRFLDAEYIEMLEGLEDEDEQYYNVYALGLWGVLKNVIYSKWSELEPAAWSKPFEVTVYGLDFGFNNQTALIEINWYDGQPYERELIYETNLTNQDLIDRLKQLKIKGRIYADHAEPARIEEISRAGFDIVKADKSVSGGIDTVKRFHTYIHEDSTNLIAEKQGYKYKEDRNGNVLDEPVKFKDHAVDAERYGIHSRIIELNKPRSSIAFIP